MTDEGDLGRKSHEKSRSTKRREIWKDVKKKRGKKSYEQREHPQEIYGRRSKRRKQTAVHGEKKSCRNSRSCHERPTVLENV